MSDGETIGPADLPFDGDIDLGISQASGHGFAVPGAQAGDAPMTEQLEGLERELITRAMQQARGVKTQAAELLGIKTSALYYKLEKYSVEYAEET